MVTDMKIDIEAARALTYETARVCDHENNNLRVLEMGPPLDKDEEKRRKQLSRSLKRMNGMLTPMSKYYCSEMCNRVAYDAIQVLGGSGYMKDYAAERHARDARITTIYEGTSQLQVVAAVRGVTSGSLDAWTAEHEKTDLRRSAAGRTEAEARRRPRPRGRGRGSSSSRKGAAYLDLAGRKLVDSALTIIIGHLLLGQGAATIARSASPGDSFERELPDAADELRADPHRRHDGDGRIRSAGRPRARGGVNDRRGAGCCEFPTAVVVRRRFRGLDGQPTAAIE